MTKTKPRSPAQLAVTRHNSMIGLSVCIQKNAQTIGSCLTASDDARSLAVNIENMAELLETALRAERKS